MTGRKILQAISFIAFAAAISVFFYGASSIATAVSPLVGLANLINGHPWTWKLLLAVPVIVLALFKGRYFCFYICPTGTILERVPFGGKREMSFSSLTIALLVVVLASSFFTLAIVGLLDPVGIFAMAINVFQYSFKLHDLWLVLPLLVLIGLNIFGRRYWCKRLCPLGAMLMLIGKAGAAMFARGKRKQYPWGLSRRSFLASLLGGLALGWMGSRTAIGGSRRLIRPPGSLPEDLFNRKCMRCGNCMKACITNGIQPCFLEAGWDGIFTPRLVPSVGYCDEYCIACTQSCPTGAIRHLSLEEKREERLGLARVDKERCLAWSYNAYCLVCMEYCSYNAIDIQKNDNGIPCPVVNPSRCRGCGQCEFKCRTKKVASIQVYSI